MNELTIVAGGRHDFMTVRHLVLRGDQTTIGHALAEEARSSAGWVPANIDPLRNRARWTWFERNWPEHYARMSGAATAFGLDPETDNVCLDGMPTLPDGSGCSAVWCPPVLAADGQGRVARNYDLFTEPGAASRPYVITMYPDNGLASTALTMSELDGCTEGINEAGLTVTLLLTGLGSTSRPTAPPAPQAGLNITQVPRFLLDTCENVDQAKQALLGAKQYDEGVPCHYLIADASGQAFVWERGAHDSEHIIEATGGPLCVTNHQLHEYPDVQDLPEDTPETFLTYQRARALAKETAGRLSAGSLRAALDAAAMSAVPEQPWRTLWRTVFDPAVRTMTSRFYLGDADNGSARYSPEVTFEVAK
ncbi:C45 family autoproteolytic acyltransferase/hydrolase [Saccharomonospora sp. NPDC046836]|uniref:C45 family autoproteolytic acyltransferase/hydolase n=1 Tax=Saccharomonospora sp. NPDC046836 TaxID=3156921 RepID=UPI0033F45980